jgi:hypothetical protein
MGVIQDMHLDNIYKGRKDSRKLAPGNVSQGK